MDRANLVLVDGDAVAFGRTTSEVLRIVYLNGNANVSAGGFFHMGLNGAIRTTGTLGLAKGPQQKTSRPGETLARSFSSLQASAPAAPAW